MYTKASEAWSPWKLGEESPVRARDFAFRASAPGGVGGSVGCYVTDQPEDVSAVRREYQVQANEASGLLAQ